MLAVDEGKLDLDAPIQRYVPAFAGHGKESITVRLLLAHARACPAWRPLFREVSSRAESLCPGRHHSAEHPSRVTVEVYSDLGAIVLTQVLEAVYHQRLDSLLERGSFDRSA